MKFNNVDIAILTNPIYLLNLQWHYYTHIGIC